MAEDSLDLNRFDGNRFTSIHPALPPHIHWLGWGNGTTALQDHAGDWWIATGEGLVRFADGLRKPPKAVYTRWERSSGKFQFEPVVLNNDRTVTAFTEDRACSKWMGVRETPPSAAALFFDSGGRLWLANRQGLFGSDDPLADSPHFQKVLSHASNCVAEDRWGRIYACTGTGVACISPARGRIRQYTAAVWDRECCSARTATAAATFGFA